MRRRHDPRGHRRPSTTLARAVRAGRAMPGARTRALATTLVTALAAALGTSAAVAGCAALPTIRSNLLPPVVPMHADTLTMSGRGFHRVATPAYELYVQSPRQLPELEEAMDAASREFARHFGGAPKVAVLLFDAPADPYAEFDFVPFVERGMQVLALVRDRGAQKAQELGVDEGLLSARLAELLLAAYADSVAREVRYANLAPEPRRALDRLPHWFVEATITRVARPEAVEPGITFVRANRPRLMPLRGLFAMARLGMPTWSELARRPGAVRVYTEPTRITPPPLLAAESTAFGEFLVSRYGPTYLQALAEELLTGKSTEDAFRALPAGDEGPASEEAWRAWLTGYGAAR